MSKFYVPAASSPELSSSGPRMSPGLAEMVASMPPMLWRHGQIVAHTGVLGAGKTAEMTVVGLAAQAAGIEVWSSYDAMGPKYPANFRRIRNMFDLLYARDCLLLIDELQFLLHARDFAQRGGAAMGRTTILSWFDLVRKDNLAIHYTTQDVGKVDLLVRQLTGFIFQSKQTHIEHVTKVQMLAYDGSEEAAIVAQYVWNRSIIYGWYDTKDKKVQLLLDPDADPVSPFPTRERLLDDLARPPASRSAKHETRAAPSSGSAPGRGDSLFEL